MDIKEKVEAFVLANFQSGVGEMSKDQGVSSLLELV